MLGPSCARQRRHRSSAVMSSTGPATVICCPAQPRQSAGLLLHWNSANNPPDTFSPGRSFVPQEMLASGSRATAERRAAPATAELFSCTVQTRPRAAGSRQPQKTGWNYLIFYTARPRRLLTLSSSPLSQVSLFTPAAASPSFSLFLVCPSARCVEVSTNFRGSFHNNILHLVKST